MEREKRGGEIIYLYFLGQMKLYSSEALIKTN